MCRAFKSQHSTASSNASSDILKIAQLLPYGGYKLSGLGRENGLAALEEYTEIKTVVVELATGMPADPFAD